jgi:hypothetical protein
MTFTLREFLTVRPAEITIDSLRQAGYPSVKLTTTWWLACDGNEVAEWCEANLLNGWAYDINYYWFDSQEDATLFQLKWM